MRLCSLILFGLCYFCTMGLSLRAQRVFVPKRGGCQVRELPSRRGFEVLNTAALGPRVLARVPDGDMQQALQHPTFRWILECYSRAAGGVVPPVLRAADEPERVDALLTDLWHQFEPYNALTPEIDGTHCATGCVAHALAEVIRYHRYAACEGSYTYIDSIGCGQSVTVDFPATGYDFDHMLDRYDEGCYTPEELAAVATLLRDCGAVVHMQYGVESSAAYSVRQPIALADFFGYDRGLQMYFRDFYTYAEWERMLRRELAEARPVLMSARSASLSHAFCCDGYDEAGLFHLNLGMGGDADGYYYLPYLTPKQPQWYDETSPEGGMNLLQYMTVGIRPPASPNEAQTEQHSFGMSHIEALTGEASRRDSLRLATYYMGNMGWNHHPGRVALMLKDGETVLPLVDYGHDFLLEELTDTTYTDTLAFVLPSAVGDGLYRIVPAFEQAGDSWEEVRASVGTPNYLFLKVSGDRVELYPDTANDARLELTDIHFPDTIVRATRPAFDLTLTCCGAEYCGRFYVVLSPVGKPDELRIIQLQGLTLNDGEVTRRDFRRTWVGVASGAYHLRVAYDKNLFTDSLIWLSEEPLKTIEVVEPTIGIPSVNEAEGGVEYIDLAGRRLAPDAPHRGIVIRKEKNTNRKTIMK